MENDEILTQQAQEIFVKLSRALLNYKKSFHNASNSAGLSPGEIGMLMSLHIEPSVDTATQIAQKLGTNKSLVSRSSSRLSRGGFVKTVSDSEDRRVMRFIITQKGSAICRELIEANRDFYQAARENIPKSDIENLIATLEKMTDNINRASSRR
ncbi:MAG: MarR family winged helix-turn-helix transcriptional regulator [Oscillospiraceae bacterium]